MSLRPSTHEAAPTEVFPSSQKPRSAREIFTHLGKFLFVVVQVLVGLITLLLLVDYFDARQASACSMKLGPNCYPWGMTEGPLEGGSWNYANKENYLLSAKFSLAVGLLTLLIPLVTRNGWIGLGLSFVIFTGGMATTHRVLEYLYPL